MTRRRGRNEGSVFQRHTPDCPPPDATGERPKHHCKGRWVGTVDLGVINGKRRRKTVYGRTRKEAAMKVQEGLSAKSSGSLVVGQVTVETWLTYWLDVICAERGLKPNTMKSHRSKVDRYLIPHLGHLRLDKLQPEHIRAMYVAMRKEGLAESTLSQTHAILSRALKVAVRERKAVYNAAAAMDRPQAEKNKRQGLTLDDAKKVLRAAGDDPRFYLALYLGMRQGECLALRWSDIDFDAGLIRIERSLTVLPGGAFEFVTPKTETSKQPLPLLTVVGSRLRVKQAAHLATGGAADDLVFARPDGRPVHPRADYQAWRDLLESAGVTPIPLHAARNTTATLLRSLGFSYEDIKAVMRHKTVEMSEHYSIEDMDRIRRTLVALEGALAD